MGIHDTSSDAVKALKGLHLYQFGPSNCSQRVRLMLTEKGLAWTAHTLDASRNEHLLPRYRAVNPMRVVPTLIDDGTVIVDSNDIIAYLDEKFSEPSFQPTDAASRGDLGPLLRESTAFQTVIKTLSHELLFRKVRRISDEDFAYFREIELEPERIAFYRDYMEDGAAWAARMDAAEKHMRSSLGRLDAILSARPWLNGGAYGLADMSWIVHVYRLMTAKLPVADFAHVETWARLVIDRPAFDKAVASYRA